MKTSIQNKYLVCLVGAMALLNNVGVVFGQIKPNDKSEFRSPQEIDGTRKQDGNQTPPATLTENLTNTDSQGQRVFDALFQELDNMIPGEFLAGSDDRKAIQDAVTAFQLQDVNRVESIFKEQATKQKNFPPPDLLLAALSYAVQDAQSGLVLLERAAIQHPDYPGVYSALSRLAINQGRISDALALLEKCQAKILLAKELDETSKTYFVSQCFDGLIDVAMRQGRLDDASKFLERQRITLPDNPKVLMVSAELEFKKENIEKSQEYLVQLKTKFPKARAPESILASWYEQSGKEAETEKWIRVASEKYPDDAQVQLEFASWAVNKEDFPTASSAIIKAEKAQSDSSYARNLMGKIAFCNESFAAAESHYKSIAELQPTNFDAVNMYALSLIESEDPQKRQLAREIATRNFRALPDNLIAQAVLGYIELKMGDSGQAQAILSRAARTPGSSPEIEYFFASLLAKLGEKEKTKLVLENALKHKGIFLYRKSAERLLAEVSKASDSLPEPDKSSEAGKSPQAPQAGTSPAAVKSPAAGKSPEPGK